MEQRNITKNYIYNLLYQILAIILPIITTPYVSRTLGAEGVGIYGYTISIVTYFTLIGALGIANYGQREIAYVQEDREKRSKTFWELVILRLILVILTFISFLLIFCISGEYTFYYRILALEVIATAFDISWFFQGMEYFKKIVIKNLLIKMISIFLIFILIKNPNDLWKYFCIYTVSNVLGNISLWLKITQYVDIVKVRTSDLLKHIKPTISLFIPQIATSIYTVLDKTMLGNMCTDIAEVGYYEQSQKIIKIALTLVTTMTTVMIPRIAKNYAKGDKEQVKKYMIKTFNFIWFLAMPITFGIMAISNKFVPWFFGNGYEKVSILMIMSSLIIPIISFSSVIGAQFLMTTKRQNIHTRAVIAGALLNVIINFILLKEFQSVGAVISTIIAELTISVIEIIYVVKNNLIELKELFYHSLRYILLGIIMFGLVFLIQNYMQMGIINTMIQILIGGFVYIIGLLIIKDEFVYDIIRKLKKEKRT